MIIFCWIFILLVTVYDIKWMFDHSDTVCIWESNPFALWIITNFGPKTSALFRISTVTITAGLMPFTSRKFAIASTSFVFAVHFYLAVIYFYIYFFLNNLCD